MKNNRKIFIVGASGYIGSLLYKSFKSDCVVYGTSSAVTTDLMHLSLDAPAGFDYGLIQRSDVVLLAAAISSPDICAREHAHAWAVNVTGTMEFINRVIARGARVVFFSSDMVYGERSEAFDETAESLPAGEYAAMKRAVEKQFLGNPLFKSIRLSYVFSHEDKFTKYLSSCAERGEEAELFHPFYRAIVHRDDIVDGALALVERWDEFPQQVINFGGPALLSRIDFAECLRRTALPNLRFRVTEPNAAFFESRPREIAMTSPVLPNLLGRPTHTLADAVQIEFASS